MMDYNEGVWVSFEHDGTPRYGWVDIRSPRSHKTINLVINNSRFVYDTKSHTFTPECCCEARYGCDCCCENLPSDYWGDNYYYDDE